MKLKAFSALIITTLCLTEGFSLTYSKKLKEKDILRLEKGEFIVKSIGNVKNASVIKDEKTALVLDAFSDIRTHYIAEILYKCPVQGNEDFIKKLNKALIDVEHYVDIPYYSERNKAWFNMYESAEITDIKKEGSTTTILETLEMQMFGKFSGQIDIEDKQDYYLYKLKNLEPLRYHGKFKVCDTGEMQSVIAIYQENGYWIVYVLGGVYTPYIPFIGSRAESSFINRVIAFTDFVFKQL